MPRIRGSDLNAMMNLLLLMLLNIYKSWTIIIPIYHDQGKILYVGNYFVIFVNVDGNSEKTNDALQTGVVCVTYGIILKIEIFCFFFLEKGK